MRIAVISDLHLGCGGPADDFGHEDEAFLRFLDHLEARPNRSALELTKRRGVDVLVTGHTHHPSLHRVGQRQLVNAGSCWRAQHQWVSVETKRGNCALHTSWV